MKRPAFAAGALAAVSLVTARLAVAQPAPAPAQPAAAPAPGATASPASLVIAPAPLPGGRRMTFAECIALAQRQNLDVHAADARVDEARAARAGEWGRFLPKLRAEGQAVEWDSPFDLPFSLGSGPPANFHVRDAFTWTAAGTATQPVTKLLETYDRYKVKDLGVDVASIEREVTKRHTAFRVGQAFLRLLQTTRLAEIAQVSVEQLDAQRRQAQSLFDNGVVGKSDLLRADLAVANARQRAIQMQGQVTVTRGDLALVVGLPVDTPIDPVPPPGGDLPLPVDRTIEQAEARAVANRVELRALTTRIEQEHRSVAAARDKLLPEASIVGNYTHTEGFAFSQKNAAYVGVAASWDFWDWGTNYNAVGEEKARLHQAEIARTKLADQVRAEARRGFVDTQTAKQALEVARAAVAQAEENYRIVTKRYAANNASYFDVVDAEALLTQARGSVETALYDYFGARGELDEAMGESLPHF